MAKMRNMYLYRDVLIIMQILDLREKWSEPLLETITTSEEMCYMMALEDVQRLADDTNVVTKKVHGSRYLAKFEGVVEETITDSQLNALKPAGGIPRNQILQARHPSLGTSLRKGLTQAALDTHLRSALNASDFDKTHQSLEQRFEAYPGISRKLANLMKQEQGKPGYDANDEAAHVTAAPRN